MDRETREGPQNSDSPLPDLPDEAPLSSVDEDVVPGEVDGDLYELHQQVVASEEHIANLESELKEAADQEAETAQRFNTERQRRVALDQQLHQAREEAAHLILDEASQTRSAIRAEAEELLQATRVQAERETGRVTKRAFDKANEMIAIARREAVAIVDAGREQPNSEQTTSSSPPQESLPTDLEAPSALASDEPASIEIPPLTGR